jgi:hypothetical protein
MPFFYGLLRIVILDGQIMARHRRISGTEIGQRLLTRDQAATYCGVSVLTLIHVCPVRLIALGSSKRLERYDIRRLDEWIDTFGHDGAPYVKDWLAALDAEDDSRSRKGN